jgi:hypothetical protein
MDMSELQEMIATKAGLEKKIASLEQAASTAGFAATPGLEEAVNGMRNARWAIGFGIGELHYDNVRGWPWRKLAAFIEVFEKMPGLDADDRDWVRDTKSFCEGARLRELERAGRKPDDKPAPLTL